MLTRRLQLLTPPPVSVRLAADVGGYTSGLTRYRFGETSAWVSWFSDAVAGAGRAQQLLVEREQRIRTDWRARLADHRNARALRSDSAAWQVLDLLPRHLVLTAPVVADALGLTRKGAGDALRTLAAAGILTACPTVAKTGQGRPPQLYVSEELLGLVGSSPLRR